MFLAANIKRYSKLEIVNMHGCGDLKYFGSSSCTIIPFQTQPKWFMSEQLFAAKIMVWGTLNTIYRDFICIVKLTRCYAYLYCSKKHLSITYSIIPLLSLLTHSCTHKFTHSFIYSHTHSITHAHTQHLPSHLLT